MLNKFFKRIKCPPLSQKEQGLFAERLSLLLGASLSLPESIAVMQNSFGKSRNEPLRKLEKSLNDGKGFEPALSNSPLGFSRMIIIAARIGERSGTLSESLVSAAGRIERGRALKSAIISAMMYPSIIFLASAGIISFLVFFIMPKIMPTIESLHVPLPAVTVFFIFISHSLVDHWWKIILVSISLMAVLCFLYSKSPSFKALIHRLVFRIPVISTIIRAHALSEIFDIVSTLVSAGCPFIESVTESSAFVSLIPCRRALSEAVKGMQSGLNFSEILRQYPSLFPDLTLDSLAIGERTGNMEAVLPQISRYYTRELGASLNSLSKLLEPAMMIVVGIIVGAAALSIVLPIYEISQHLSG